MLNVMFYLTTLATAEVISALPDVPEFCPAGILGTPTEETWPGVTHLPGYKSHKLGFYRGQKLGLSFPRLYDVMEGESMASALLQGADCNSDHYLVIGELRERLSVAKRVEQQVNITKFNILKLKDEEAKQNYQVEISNRFATLESSDEVDKELDVNSVWENIRDSIKIAAEQSIGYYETKKKKPWFDEDCCMVVERRKQAKLKFLQDPVEEKRDNYFNERREASRTLRNKKRGYLKEKLNELNADDRIGAEEALRHRYFSPLPHKLYELPDEALCFCTTMHDLIQPMAHGICCFSLDRRSSTTPPYSPDLEPSDFHLFRLMKCFLAGKRFRNDDEIQTAVTSWLQTPKIQAYKRWCTDFNLQCRRRILVPRRSAMCCQDLKIPSKARIFTTTLQKQDPATVG
ncbi:hypothetical protein ANN_11109 [Periplaneta americana]|uniref:Uncharacterized protein n=1 Tax=Periplaneta americana TaxID=6978 RepID=A0ABQ8T6D9_PERAM|nr:hypothetical protein ANN_11109 [Periplaneta americana]